MLVAQIATAVYAYLHHDELLKLARESFKSSVRNEYSQIESKTLAYDAFQKHVSIYAVKHYIWETEALIRLCILRSA